VVAAAAADTAVTAAARPPPLSLALELALAPADVNRASLDELAQPPYVGRK